VDGGATFSSDERDCIRTRSRSSHDRPQVLLAFGIDERTREYDRWIKDEGGPGAGFDLDDFNEVLFDSPFILNVDWCDVLQEDLE
jgi:hypothetical protein